MMNQNDTAQRQKKKQEISCLQKCILLAPQKSGFTRRFLSSLQEPLETCLASPNELLFQNERPDIVLPVQNAKGKKIIGIEHFQVHQLTCGSGNTDYSVSIKTGDKLQAALPILKKQLWAGLQKAANLTSDDNTDSIKKNLAEKMSLIRDAMIFFGYTNLYVPLKKSVDTHGKKIDDYRLRLKEIAQKEGANEYSFGFLIDIYTFFPLAFFNIGKNIRVVRDCPFIFTPEIVRIFSEILMDKCDFIIISMQNENSDSPADVIVLKKNLCKDYLQRNGTDIFRYFGVNQFVSNGFLLSPYSGQWELDKALYCSVIDGLTDDFFVIWQKKCIRA